MKDEISSYCRSVGALPNLAHTVDWEIFGVTNFLPVAEISYAHVNARTFLTQKKATRKFPDLGISMYYGLVH